ncbi:MAG TPA: hypothetical protein VHM88_22580 [Candidatus Acidoferrales bacterium]|nr:hypothetical protein [Candidatus Acidoferrales bacterium]
MKPTVTTPASLPRIFTAMLAALLTAATLPGPALAQSTSTVASTVPDGTRFLVRLEDELSTRKSKVNKKFKAHTLEPLQAADGTILPSGAEVRGHISRIESAGLTGRARLWLTFDEIKTAAGKMPLVAEVVSVPGDFSVRQGESKEGEIEARTSKGRRDVEAAAAGAAIGAVAGAATKGGKGAGIGAALGAATGFLISSGIGQELDLPKGTKLELELERSLYVARR